MATDHRRNGSEQGAILVHVALGLFALMAFSTFVVDYGVFWVSRRQAQNVADAAAFAGAIALAYDDMEDRAPDGPAATSALSVSQQTFVWGAPPAVDPATDIAFPACPDGTETCVRVDVYRNQDRDNPLPMIFGQLVGLGEQGVRATATAQALQANASDCLRPFAVMDKWAEFRPAPGTWTPDDAFQRYQRGGPSSGQLLDPADVYTPPATEPSGSPGTGFTVDADRGTRMVLKVGNPQQLNGAGNFSPGWFMPLALAREEGPASGAAEYRENVASCNGQTVAIGDYVPTQTGNMTGPTRQGIEALVAQDPTAYWDADSKSVQRPGCAPSCPQNSPRIVDLPVVNPDLFQRSWYSNPNTFPEYCPTGGSCVQIVNIVGFFVEGMSGQDVIGYLVSKPGDLAVGGPGVAQAASFLTVIRLVR